MVFCWFEFCLVSKLYVDSRTVMAILGKLHSTYIPMILSVFLLALLLILPFQSGRASWYGWWCYWRSEAFVENHLVSILNLCLHRAVLELYSPQRSPHFHWCAVEEWTSALLLVPISLSMNLFERRLHSFSLVSTVIFDVILAVPVWVLENLNVENLLTIISSVT